jgi:Fe-S cluster biogenesis protein NfuA
MKNQQEIITQINQLLEKNIRPRIQMDGGDISLQKFEDGVVYVQLHGACVGCPISQMTLKMGVESLLKEHIKEVVRVEKIIE